MKKEKNQNLLKKAKNFINFRKLAFKSIAIGTVAGMRSMLAPAVVSHYLNKLPSPSLAASNLKFMQASVTAFVTKLLSVTEIIGDKMPFASNRIRINQLIARIASGGIAGGTLYKANNKSAVQGILLGSLSAVAATFGSFYFRKYLDKLPFLTDIVTGSIEDIIAINSGLLIMQNNQ